MMRVKWPLVLGLLMLISLGACANESTSAVEQPDNDKNIQSNEVESVATIEGKTFDTEDLAFYTFMEQIEIEANRYHDLEGLAADTAAERDLFWDEQAAYLENINVQLQNMVEIYAIRLLAEEKHYDVPMEKLDAAVNQFKDSIAEIDTVQAMIQEYGETKFNRNIQDYMRSSLLRDRVVNDLLQAIQTEKPEQTEQEQSYQLQQDYEELLIDQMNTLEIEIHVK